VTTRDSGTPLWGGVRNGLTSWFVQVYQHPAVPDDGLLSNYGLLSRSATWLTHDRHHRRSGLGQALAGQVGGREVQVDTRSSAKRAILLTNWAGRHRFLSRHGPGHCSIE